MCPTPEAPSSKKIQIFYGGYNFVANTHKFITFEESEIVNTRDHNLLSYERPRK